ncbi:methyltransferase [Amycolatopsis acidiphila]|nr:methyltransferase [Amycolatopsis acidiphila]
MPAERFTKSRPKNSGCEDSRVTRIVAGRAGGRRLRVPPQGTRPTSERVRESLFNALESAGELAGARVLDLYAGSGALGLEALSRGAEEAVFVESDRRAVQILRGNVAELALGGVVRAGQVESVLAQAAEKPFDLVLADPPYAVDAAKLGVILAALGAGGWVAEDGLVIVERAQRDGEPDWPAGFAPLRAMRHGDTALYWAEYVTSARSPR